MSTSAFNRLLVLDDDAGFRIGFQDRAGTGLRFQVEELVGIGAAEIALTQGFYSTRFVDHLTPGLRKRVQIVDENFACRNAAWDFLNPIDRELDAQHGFLTHWPQSAIDNFEPLMEVQQLYTGMRYGLTIGMDIDAVRSAVQYFRSSLKHPESREVLAILEGVLANYKPYNYCGIEVRQSERADVGKLFEDLVHEHTYEDMSRSFSMLGYEVSTESLIRKINTLATTLVQKRRYKELLSIAYSSVKAVTGGLLPDASQLKGYFSNGFMPPIVSYEPLWRSARERWARVHPEQVPHWYRGSKSKAT